MGDEEEVAAPTLIISGDKDHVVTPAHPARLQKAIPHAGSYEFSEASHSFVMERPRDFARVVAAFLN
jgi:monooxygenase